VTRTAVGGSRFCDPGITAQQIQDKGFVTPFRRKQVQGLSQMLAQADDVPACIAQMQGLAWAA
jgi:hypothetical protein